jgi:hypothetical protein
LPSVASCSVSALHFWQKNLTESNIGRMVLTRTTYFPCEASEAHP